MNKKKIRSIDVYVGEQIKTFREMKGLSQADLASKIKLSRTSICNIEVGRQSVSLELLFRISLVLGLTNILYFVPDMDWFKINNGKQLKKVVTYIVCETINPESLSSSPKTNDK